MSILSSSNFRRKRRNSYSEKVFQYSLSYIIFCYQLLIKEGITYSKKNIHSTSTSKLEDYYRDKLLYDYIQNKMELFKEFDYNKYAVINEFLFYPETRLPYKDGEKERGSELDIHIVNLSVDMLGKRNRHSGFLIECKRLVNNSLNDEYIKNGIKRIIERVYKEGFNFASMLAFIESGEIEKICDDINFRLDNSYKTTIKTHQALSSFLLINNFAQSFLSRHDRVDGTNINIYHLFFDYTKVICE